MTIQICELNEAHSCVGFSCGKNDVIDEFVLTKALKHHTQGSTRVKVATEDGVVVGFYALAANNVTKNKKLKAFFEKSEDYPAFHLQMIAVHKDQARNDLGPALMLDALEAAARASKDVGALMIYLEAAHERLVAYYERWGFSRVSSKELSMYIPMHKVWSSLEPLETESGSLPESSVAAA